jgi:RNA polymerase sigma-70 factor, ECF subfamily
MGAFREGIVALVPRLRASARALAGGDRHLADDLVQDAVALALRGQGRFTPGTDLRAWLFTILRNRFRSVVTRKHVRAEVAADGDDLGRAVDAGPAGGGGRGPRLPGRLPRPVPAPP